MLERTRPKNMHRYEYLCSIGVANNEWNQHFGYFKILGNHDGRNNSGMISSWRISYSSIIFQPIYLVATLPDLLYYLYVYYYLEHLILIVRKSVSMFVYLAFCTYLVRCIQMLFYILIILSFTINILSTSFWYRLTIL